MNVLLLGEHGEQLDEGMKNTSVKLYESIGAHEAVTLLDLRATATAEFWKHVATSDADVVHLIPGPTPQGLTLLKLIGALHGAKTVATATQPLQVTTMKRLSPVLAPDRLLAQSTSVQQEFETSGFETAFVPSGVDLAQFSPQAEKAALREKLGLPHSERLFLHVGHCKAGRNVRALTHLNKYGTVVIVGSPSTGPESAIVSELQSAGCLVRTEYVERIEDYYNAADVYVFPTIDSENSIQVPLSVFEAMGCNLPVLATQFGGLTDCFEAGAGLQFVDSIEDITERHLEFENVDTRGKVADYGWSAIGDRVVEIYNEL